MSIRLNKLMAQRGIGARRKCDLLIEEGRVRVNGETVRELGTMVEEGRDRIEVSGRPLPPAPELRYYVLNKPVGVISTLEDPEGRRTVREYLPPGSRLYPVGRLDADTSGLLVLTNDGDLAHRLMHPRYGVEKVYRAWLDQPPSPAQLERLRNGVEFEPGVTSSPARVKQLEADRGQGLIEIAIHEGRYRQVRRMCEAVGLQVTGLHRWAYGPIKLGPIERGMWRELSGDEVKHLKSASARPVSRGRGGRGEFFSARRGLVSSRRGPAAGASDRARPPVPRDARPTRRPGERPQRAAVGRDRPTRAFERGAPPRTARTFEPGTSARPPRPSERSSSVRPQRAFDRGGSRGGSARPRPSFERASTTRPPRTPERSSAARPQRSFDRGGSRGGSARPRPSFERASTTRPPRTPERSSAARPQRSFDRGGSRGGSARPRPSFERASTTRPPRTPERSSSARPQRSFEREGSRGGSRGGSARPPRPSARGGSARPPRPFSAFERERPARAERSFERGRPERSERDFERASTTRPPERRTRPGSGSTPARGHERSGRSDRARVGQPARKGERKRNSGTTGRPARGHRER